MTHSSTALGLRPPTRRITRVAVRGVSYALVLVVFLAPIWSIVSTAFSGFTAKRGQISLLPKDPTLANLTQAWHLGVGRGLVNSAIVTVIGLTLQLLVSSMAAYALARKRFRGASLVMVLILATMMMPEEIIAIPLYLVLGRIPNPLEGGNLLNSYAGLILPVVGWALPIYMLTGFMRTIPIELEEAARMDGAGDARILFRVILPLCKPALGTCAVFGFLMIWDQFLLPLLVAQSPDRYTLTLIVSNLQASQELSEQVRLAAALVLLIPSVTVYLLMQRFFERGLLSGSVKG